jgi:hypothetical protein
MNGKRRHQTQNPENQKYNCNCPKHITIDLSRAPWRRSPPELTFMLKDSGKFAFRCLTGFRDATFLGVRIAISSQIFKAGTWAIKMKQHKRFFVPDGLLLAPTKGRANKQQTQGIKASARNLFVPEGQHDRRLARSTWDSVTPKEPSGRARFDS